MRIIVILEALAMVLSSTLVFAHGAASRSGASGVMDEPGILSYLEDRD